jgi:hypothetical protein
MKFSVFNRSVFLQGGQEVPVHLLEVAPQAWEYVTEVVYAT